jgi:hypothetical protein
MATRFLTLLAVLVALSVPAQAKPKAPIKVKPPSELDLKIADIRKEYEQIHREAGEDKLASTEKEYADCAWKDYAWRMVVYRKAGEVVLISDEREGPDDSWVMREFYLSGGKLIFVLEQHEVPKNSEEIRHYFSGGKEIRRLFRKLYRKGKYREWPEEIPETEDTAAIWMAKYKELLDFSATDQKCMKASD